VIKIVDAGAAAEQVATILDVKSHFNCCFSLTARRARRIALISACLRTAIRMEFSSACTRVKLGAMIAERADTRLYPRRWHRLPPVAIRLAGERLLLIGAIQLQGGSGR
jgi:hypothetical protein